MDNGVVGTIDDDLIPLSRRILKVNGTSGTTRTMQSNPKGSYGIRKRGRGKEASAKRKRVRAAEAITDVLY